MSSLEVGAGAPWQSPAPGPDAAQEHACARDATYADVRVGAALAVVLLVVGALLGLIWQAWSPARPAALVLGGGQYEVLAEDESLVAADGRFLVITTVVGVMAALFAWYALPRHRGPVVLLGLAAGAAGGAALTELVGHLSGGGSRTGRKLPLTDGSSREVTVHLPLSLHIHWLVASETIVIALLYGLFVAFTEHDNLGRPDPVRAGIRTRRGLDQLKGESVDTGGDTQHGG